MAERVVGRLESIEIDEMNGKALAGSSRRLNTEVMTALRAPDVLAKYEAFGVDPVKPNRPDEFGAMLRKEIARWGEVIRAANVKAP